VPDAETPAPLAEAIAAGMQEEVRDAQRERWRAEVRLQAALDQLRFFEGKAKGMEEQNGELRSHIVWLERELEAITTSRAWETVVKLRRLQQKLRPGRR
jgi:IS1 family transposase